MIKIQYKSTQHITNQENVTNSHKKSQSMGKQTNDMTQTLILAEKDF